MKIFYNYHGIKHIFFNDWLLQTHQNGTWRLSLLRFSHFCRTVLPTVFPAPAPYPLRTRSDCSTVFGRRNIGETTAQYRGGFVATKFFFLN